MITLIVDTLFALCVVGFLYYCYLAVKHTNHKGILERHKFNTSTYVQIPALKQKEYVWYDAVNDELLVLSFTIAEVMTDWPNIMGFEYIGEL